MNYLVFTATVFTPLATIANATNWICAVIVFAIVGLITAGITLRGLLAVLSEYCEREY